MRGTTAAEAAAQMDVLGRYWQRWKRSRVHTAVTAAVRSINGRVTNEYRDSTL